MEDKPMHILTKEGILASFSVAKKITEEEINAMMTDARYKSKNEDEIIDLIKTRIVKEIIDATQKGTLPGIILENIQDRFLPIKSLESLNRMVEVLSQKIKQKKLDKISLCYFINYLVGSLGLVEEDFEEFYRQIKEIRGEDEDDE